MTLLRSQKDHALLLFFVKDKLGVYRTPKQGGSLAGVVAKIPNHPPLEEWLVGHAMAIINTNFHHPSLTVHRAFRKTISICPSQWSQQDTKIPYPQTADVDVFVLSYEQPTDLDHTWVTMPELMNTTRQREAKKLYLLIWQVLMGGLNEPDVKVIDNHPSSKKPH
ncbi:MAG: hypothetical protein OXC40_07370 [Proteobacteria bacterium]|nr:hypothetical protein [Pseudomonadota bacterium]